MSDARPKVLVLFGTRPEVIKLAPVVRELQRRKDEFEIAVVSSGQHRDLIKPFLKLFDIEINHDLDVMLPGQTPNDVCARVLTSFDQVLQQEQPQIVLVQGDTTTAFAGAITAFHRQIPVGHVEAGLRSGNVLSPFPEEMNRRLVTNLASLHFAATEHNRQNLLKEQVGANQIFVTGNPVVDALHFVSRSTEPSRDVQKLLEETSDKRRILLTTHRRENFGATMRENLFVLRDFVRKHDDVALLFPVHPNPNVRSAVNEILREDKRICLLEPLGYENFVALMRKSWIIISDSGGVQEEAPSLGVPLLVLRENTERPEAIETGVARLVGDNPLTLARLLEEIYYDDSWLQSVQQIPNPFGDGTAARKIVDVLADQFR